MTDPLSIDAKDCFKVAKSEKDLPEEERKPTPIGVEFKRLDLEA